MSERSFISRSPSLTLPPEPSIHPPFHGKTVYHENGPWCQKGWGPFTALSSSCLVPSFIILRSFFYRHLDHRKTLPEGRHC